MMVEADHLLLTASAQSVPIAISAEHHFPTAFSTIGISALVISLATLRITSAAS